MESLYQNYVDQGLEVLGFPCNQFSNQEPGTDEEIKERVERYGANFPLFAKIDVNGDNESPLFTYLKSKKGGILGKKIKWNFSKFLVDRQGNVVARYAPTTKPEDIEKKIKELL